MKRKSIHPHAIEAMQLLGARIAAARRERSLTEEALAQRLGISRPTVRKIERGDPSVGMGTAFDAAAVLGVSLFHDDAERVRLELSRATDALRLLPERVCPSREVIDDDF